MAWPRRLSCCALSTVAAIRRCPNGIASMVALAALGAGNGCCLSSVGVASASGGSTTGSGPCPAGDVRVNGACVAVGNACGPETVWVGDTCVTQGCTTSLNYLPCQLNDGGLGSCSGGQCFDLESDPRNCGWYRDTCPPATFCIRGGCEYTDGGEVGCPPLCASRQCSPDREDEHCIDPGGGGSVYGLCCGGVCVAEDADNCEICGFKCADGGACYGETCGPVESSCADAGLGSGCWLGDGSLGSCCPQGCAGSSDALNCGGCGMPCPIGATCSYGACSRTCTTDLDCPTGTGCWSFPGADPMCVPRTCGDRFPGQLCVIGDGGSGICCSGDCVPAESTCGCETCALGDFCGELGCIPYVDCTTEQPSGFDNYDSACLTDAGARGACCGSTCLEFADGGRCNVSSRCDPSSGPLGVGGCILGQSLYGACCGDACVDLNQDPANCGWCGNVCASGICQFYQRGDLSSCLPRGSGQSCLVSCPAWATCVQGTCVAVLCPGETTPPLPCQAENGTIGQCCDTAVCAHPLDDPQNCGTCGNACRPGDTCVNGSCSGFPGCGLGHLYWYCGDGGNPNQICCPSAGCTNLLADSSNCGYCGSACLPGQTCVDGGCAPSGS